MSSRSSNKEQARGSRFRSGGGLAWIWALVVGVGTAVGQDGEVPEIAPLPPPSLVGLDWPDGDAAPALIAESTGARSVLEVKVGQGRFLNLTEDLAKPGKPAPFLAVGDPNVADFAQVGPRQLRIVGKRLGITDLSITTAAGKTHDFELRVTGDLETLNQQLLRMFPSARLSLSQLRDRIVVEGQARDPGEVNRIIQVIDGYIRAAQRVSIAGQVANARDVTQEGEAEAGMDEGDEGREPPEIPPAMMGGFSVAAPAGFARGGASSGYVAAPASAGAITTNQIATNQTQVINLIRVPTSQQVLLKVRVAELNRTGFRQVGADFLGSVPALGGLFGSQIGGGSFEPGKIGGTTFPHILNGKLVEGDPKNLVLGSTSTLFGTFSRGEANAFLSALRRNNLLKILAEPNLVTLNGHQANFLAGGQFPVPVNSGLGGGVGGGNVQVQFKDFGVRLAFLPIIEDGETIRLTVDPEVSTPDFSLATTLVPGGSPVPGLNTRTSHTTVELKQGETLAIAGLMSLTLDGSTARIPVLGDLPIIGAFFSNTTSDRIEKELVVLVTPYLVEPMRADQTPPLPGDEVDQPTDLEFFLMNRIEGRTGQDARATTRYDDPMYLLRPALVERKYLIGPSGYSK